MKNKRYGSAVLGLLALVMVSCSGKEVPNQTEVENESSNAVQTKITLTEPVSTDVVLSEEGRKGSLVREGNPSRILHVMERAAAGEEITIAFIGGSITQGSNASPMESSCYAYLTYEWFVKSFPDAKINYVNAGIGGTDSYLGVHRLEEDVLVQHPDLVITEFAVNDGESYNKESYECLLRRIMESGEETAVLPLILTTEGGWDQSDVQQLLAFNYELPIISYKEAMRKGNIAWSEVGDADGVHPKNAGHRLIANLLTNYFYELYYSEKEYASYTIPEGMQTKGRYMDAALIYAEEVPALEYVTVVSMDGFEEENFASPLQTSSGYGCANGGEIVFEIEATAVGICFAQSAEEPGGDFIVSVDGVEVTTINTEWPTRGWNKTATVEVMKEKECGKHTIRIQSEDEASMHILALMISR